VAQERSIQGKRKDFIGMIRAWFDTEAFIRAQPERAVAIMSKIVAMSPEQYRVFLPGTHFFDAAANLEAFDAANAHSLVRVAPDIASFLLANRLIDGQPNAAKGIDRSVLDAAIAAGGTAGGGARQ
jgi:NitT/TauT family transport system substrate-binding protein